MSYPCKVRDGKFVEPCTSLAGAMDGHPFGKGKALCLYEMSDLKSGKPSRSFVVLRMGQHRTKGITLNFCPFCGERIDASFNDEQ